MRGEADNLTKTNMELLSSIQALNTRVKERDYTIANRDASIEELHQIIEAQQAAQMSASEQEGLQNEIQILHAKVTSSLYIRWNMRVVIQHI